MTSDEKYISRCIQLAKNALGKTYPNPMVGCVIVHDGKIIGEGFHLKAGEPHAEVNAINSVEDKGLLPKSTIYVSLEPCSHYGKTPPCSDLIIHHNIKNVVIGTQDPFAKVNGLGIKKLLSAGCNLKVGVCEQDCFELNKRFFTFHEKQRPYIILKWAESHDGFLSPYTYDNFDSKAPVWLSNSYSKQLVHQWRAEEEAILVGTHTALMDNPELSVRQSSGKNPVRILIDKNLRVSSTYKIFNKASKTIVFTQKEKENQDHISYCKVDFSSNIVPQILKELYKRDIQSLIVEGGQYTLQSFINAQLWDEARVFDVPVQFKGGTAAPQFSFKAENTLKMKDNTLSFFYNT